LILMVGTTWGEIQRNMNLMCTYLKTIDMSTLIYLSVQFDIIQMAWHAAQINDKHLLLNLIQRGEDIEKRGGEPVPSTPLQIAAQHQDCSVLKILLEHGANTEAVDCLGRTVLHTASFEGRIRIVTLLLLYGANVRTKSNDGKCAIHFAIEKGRLDVIEKLIANRADVSAADNHGWTPLHYAAEKQSEDVSFTLLLANAKMTRTKQGLTPSDVARHMGRIPLARELDRISVLQGGERSLHAAPRRTPEHQDMSVHRFY
jgi:ankyrin repeat protein